MDTQDVTNPESVAEEAPEAEVTDELDEGTEAEETSSPEEELEDLELDGKTYKIPKAIKPLTMLQADYTRKTQEVAEQRRAVEAQIQAHQADIAHVGRLQNVDERLHQHTQYFNSPEWMQLKAEDPTRAQSIWMDYQQLRDTRTNLASELTAKQQQRQFETERNRATQIEQARATLAKPDPAMGWSGKLDADLKGKLDSFAYRAGYTDDQLRNASPHDVKVLNLAMLGEQFLKQQKAAAKPAKPEAQPVQQVKRGNANVVRGLSDDLPIEEWTRRRNEQLARAGKR